MSTQINHYVLWGVYLPSAAANKYEVYEAYLDSPYNTDMNPKDGITVLSGEGYLVIGHVIAKSENYQPLEMVETNKAEVLEEAATAAFNLTEAVTGKRPDLADFGWIVLGHYR